MGLLIENNTIAIILVAFLLVLISVQGAQNITMKSGTDTFVEKTSQLYQDFDHLYMNLFGTEAVVVIVEGSDIQNPDVLSSIDHLEKMSASIPGVTETNSIAGILKEASYQMGGRYSIPDDRDGIRELASASVPDYLLPDETHTLIYVRMAGDSTDDQKQEILREVESAVDMAGFPADYNVIVTGDPAFMVSMNEEMMSSMGLLLMLSILLMIVVLYLVFGHVRWRLMPLAIVLLGIVYTFGAMGYLDIPMTMVSMAAFPVLIGLGIDYAIQFHNRIEEELSRGDTPAEAVVDTVKHTGPAVLIALIITALGFVSLGTSSVPMIQDFAKLLLIGILMCFLASLFVGVTVIYGLDYMKKKREARPRKDKLHHRLITRRFRSASTSKRSNKGSSPDMMDKALGKITSFTISHPYIILLLAGSLCMGGLVADTFVPIQTDTQTFVPQDMPALIDLKHLSSITGGEDQLSLIIKTDNVANPGTLEWMDEFSEHEITSRDNIQGSESIVDIVKSMNGGSIPDTESEIEHIYSRLSDEQKAHYMHGNNILLLNLNIGDAMGSLGLEGLEVLTDIVEADISWMTPPPGMTVTITGSSVVFVEVISALTSGRIFMTYLGLAMVFGGLLLIYRDLLKAVVPVVTMFMVVGWSGGLMYYMGLEYTPLTATLGALILGVGSEYAVLMMERYFEEKEKGATPVEAMQEAGVKIGKAIITSGLTTLFGFSALIASAFGMISSFGLITVIDVGLALLATFVIFPPLMVLLDQHRENRSGKNNMQYDDTNDGYEPMIESPLEYREVDAL